MGFKEFISFNLQKSILFLFIVFFAPMPFFFFAIAGIAPPIIYLLLMALGKNSIVVTLIQISFFIISAIFVYLIACIIIWVFEKITSNKKIQWILISLLLVVLVVASFFKIYILGDLGGGSKKLNILDILDLFFEWVK